jgi:hypothetical protein
MKQHPGILVPLCLSLGSLCLCGEFVPVQAADRKTPPRFERIVIDDNLPGGYQVEVADVNGDRKPDVVALGNGVCAWYENPTWTKRIVTGPNQTPGIISTATADIDGDGKAEIAIGYEFEMTKPKQGKLGIAVQGDDPDRPWTFKPITDVPSIHRVRWCNFQGEESPDLVVAPIFGPKAHPPDDLFDNAEIVLFLGLRPGRPLNRQSPGSGKVIHAIEAIEVEHEPSAFLSADLYGVTLYYITQQSKGWQGMPLISGAPGKFPKCGSSEVHLGTFADGRRFLATIDPWHGNEVAVCAGKIPKTLSFGPRTVIDDTLNDGHALWVADVDGDGDDEVFAGHRGKDHRVSVYDFDGNTWNRTVLDQEVAAQDLRGGDIDGDGKPDVVAVGGKTHNVIWYRPR